MTRHVRRVLMTADGLGGVWTYALDLSGALVARGIAVRLLLLGPIPAGDLQAQATERGIDLVPLDHVLDWLSKDPAEIVAASECIAEEARLFGADVVHLHAAAYAAEAEYPCPVVVVAHACVATWWSTVRGGALPGSFEALRAMTGRGYRGAAAVIAPTHAFAEQTAQTYALDALPRVVRNGRRWSAASSTTQSDEVFAAGRLWDPGKGIAALDAAAALLPWPVRAAGATVGANGEAIILQAAEPLGLLDAEAVRRRLAQRPIFVAPSSYEPFGLSVLEAAQAGCALVLSDIPTFRELWDGTAQFCDGAEPRAIAEAVEGVIGDAVLRRRLGAAARHRAGDYGLEAMVEGTLAVLEAAVLERAPRGRIDVPA